MTEYIERMTAISEACKGCNEEFSDEPCEPSECRLQQRLFAIPAADVVEVRRGKWTEVWICTEHCFSVYECSVCGKNAMGEGDFCPNCGAKMDGKGCADNGI